jgi:hypothetical protein
MLNKKYEQTERTVAEKQALVNSLEQELANSNETKTRAGTIIEAFGGVGTFGGNRACRCDLLTQRHT